MPLIRALRFFFPRLQAGDQGYHLGENGVFTQVIHFKDGTRVPLIVSFPGMKTAGQRCKALAELADLYPTLAELWALPLPNTVTSHARATRRGRDQRA
ncbi:hypothetical protein [Prosthecobacter sp.]